MSQEPGNLRRLNEQELDNSLWFSDTRRLMGGVLWVTQPIERPSSAPTSTGIRNGAGLSWDAQLGSQARVQKALICLRVNEDPERFKSNQMYLSHTHTQ